MTDQSASVLCFLVAVGDQFGPPSVSELQRTFGRKAGRLLNDLIDRGLASRRPGTSRTLRATPAGRRAARGWMPLLWPARAYRRLDTP